MNENTFTISEHKDGWWLYDKTRGMNLAMKAKSKDEAFTEAIKYYQKRLTQIESEYKVLAEKVDNFVSQFINDNTENLQ